MEGGVIHKEKTVEVWSNQKADTSVTLYKMEGEASGRGRGADTERREAFLTGLHANRPEHNVQLRELK